MGPPYGTGGPGESVQTGAGAFGFSVALTR